MPNICNFFNKKNITIAPSKFLKTIIGGGNIRKCKYHKSKKGFKIKHLNVKKTNIREINLIRT